MIVNEYSYKPLLVLTAAGLYCPAGNFYIDPHRKVPFAVITHGHSDHARAGHGSYLSTDESEWILKTRLGKNISLQTLKYGRALKVGDAEITFYPAGHVLGSAQVCVSYRGRKWVVTGDYKTEPDPTTCVPFESVQCEVFVTETTFGLPIFKWKPQKDVFFEINEWWRYNSSINVLSVLYAYSLGKAQRLLAGLDHSIGPVYVHPSISEMNDAYYLSGYRLPSCITIGKANTVLLNRGLVITPAGTLGKLIASEKRDTASAYVSGWMLSRTGRAGRNCDSGFILSDHADFPSLLNACEATEAQTVFTTHGYEETMAEVLNQTGIKSYPLSSLRV